MSNYPTGVESHGGNLRIWFIYQGKRVRESLGVPDTPKNRKMASELRTSVCYAIKTGTFVYEDRFPESKNIQQKRVKKLATLEQVSSRWLDLKKPELARSTFRRYGQDVKVALHFIGAGVQISQITNEDIIALRNELLTGEHIVPLGKEVKSVKKGRSVRTVNEALNVLKSMFSFAKRNNYIDHNPFDGVAYLKKQRAQPDPLTREEFSRLINACRNDQFSNLLTIACFTGMRHGEISALAWEDIDTKEWTITVSRNIPLKEHFALPKTDAGVRTIKLMQPAIEALKRQMLITKMNRPVDIKVFMGEGNEERVDQCTFVFSPLHSTINNLSGDWYSPGSIRAIWNITMKRAGIRHRRSYESRHTYACWALTSGANPNFVANQMGHVSAKMVYEVYGKWMSESDQSQIDMLNKSFSSFAPYMPHEAGKTG